MRSEMIEQMSDDCCAVEVTMGILILTAFVAVTGYSAFLFLDSLAYTISQFAY